MTMGPFLAHITTTEMVLDLLLNVKRYPLTANANILHVWKYAESWGGIYHGASCSSPSDMSITFTYLKVTGVPCALSWRYIMTFF